MEKDLLSLAVPMSVEKGYKGVLLRLGAPQVCENLGRCSASSGWVGEEISEEAVSNKERRRAWSERALAAPNK